jgi:hypothetical protein
MFTPTIYPDNSPAIPRIEYEIHFDKNIEWKPTPVAPFVYGQEMYQNCHNGIDCYNLWNRRWWEKQ